MCALKEDARTSDDVAALFDCRTFIRVSSEHEEHND
jgi:hypothetical protein